MPTLMYCMECKETCEDFWDNNRLYFMKHGLGFPTYGLTRKICIECKKEVNNEFVPSS